MTLHAILRHKQSGKPLTKNAFWTLPVGVFAIISLLPGNALAFEASLATSPTPQFIAQLQDLDPTTLLPQLPQELPVYTSTAVSVMAPASPITEKAVWAKPTPHVVRVVKIKPTLDTPVVLEGEASYYSRAGCLGCDPLMIMANGQPLDDNALTMAIGADKKHLVGYQARVTSLATGQSVVVRITDTGGFYQEKYGSRVADLTIATKQAIGIKGGLGQVRVEVF